MNEAPGGREAVNARAKEASEKAGKKFELEPQKTLQQGCGTTLQRKIKRNCGH
jgi:hypothetical protein